MEKDKGIGIMAAISIAIYLVLIATGYQIGVTAYTAECIIFIALTLVYYITYEKFNMTPLIFLLLQIGHITHCLGMFGFYNISPVPIGWERVTHFIGSMAFALLFFNFFKHKWDVKLFTMKNMLMILIVFFAASGVGQLVEASEFWGYLAFGEGDGAFMFGHGDGIIGPNGQEILDVNGGGWINTGYDLSVNMIGILFGILLMSINQWLIKRKKEDLDLYELEKLYLNDNKKGYSQKF